MKQLRLFVLVCGISFLACCNSKDDGFKLSAWGETYPWLGKIMADAENGMYKDGNGRKAYVTIDLLVLDGKYFVGLNYGISGGLLYDEIRDMDGWIVSPGMCQTVGQIYPLEEIGLDVLPLP